MRFLKVNKLNWIPFLLTCVIFCQNPLWPIWKSGLVISFILILIIFGYLTVVKRRKIKLLPIQWLILLLIFFIFIAIPLLSGENRFSSYITIISFLIACILTRSEKINTIQYVTKFLAIIIVISFPFWFVHVFITPLTLYSVIDLSYMKGSRAIMNNYLFFVTFSNFDFNRFYSVFDEPGVLGTLAAFILFANQYDFKKKYLIVILIGAVFTYSLAFYVLSIIGYSVFMVKTKGKIFYSTKLLILGLGIIFFLIKNDIFQHSSYNRFNNISKQLESRTDNEVNRYFDNYIRSNDAIFGKGLTFLSKSNLDNGASYKLFIIEYGLMGTFVLFMAYFSLIRQKRWSSYFLLIFFILSFLQRPGSFTAWQILLFSCTLTFLEKNITNKIEFKYD